jgi:opacity protein-like surface antigen
MRKLLTIALLVFALTPAFSQDSTQQEEKTRKFDPNRLVFGGSLGASFGDYTFINISPQVGYMFSPYFTAGAGINYVHTSEKYKYNGQTISTYNYSYAGLNFFGRFFPVKFLMLSAQPEINYSWGKIKY